MDADCTDLNTTLGLIRDHQEGDPRAFSSLYERHAPAVRRSVASRVGARLSQIVEVEDLIQETFLSVWDLMESEEFLRLTTVGAFRNLLAKIAVRKLLDQAKWHARLRRDVTRNVSIDEVGEQLVDAGERPSQAARAREVEDLREQALLEASPGDRLVIDGRENLGLSYEELGEEMGCKPANAKLRYFRAKERLRARLGPLDQ